MSEPISIRSDDPRLATLQFKAFLNSTERKVEQYLPGDNEAQTVDVKTPWGAELTAKKGDYLVSDLGQPNDKWPVDQEIFKNTYIISRPGYCMKNTVTELVPLVDLTNGDLNQMVTVHTLEGPETVRAGDFYLARGIKGEIWPYPKNRMTGTLTMAKPDLKQDKK
jgi:hypothetical protein